MRKIPTYFKKDPNNLALVIPEVDPGCEWVGDPGVLATRKFDGTAVAIINGILYKRYDVKKGKAVPLNAIPCQEADPVTGHWPHWVMCDTKKPDDKYFFEAQENIINNHGDWEDGTFELIGPKVQGNPEKYEKHTLVRHGSEVIDLPSYSFEALKYFLSDKDIDIEGIVFHHPDGRMCKIRKSDFGIKR